MKLGKFSIGLTVKDIKASQAFYEKFGFEVIDGSHINQIYPLQDGEDWLMLKQGEVYIGLYQGMFNQNIITFKPTNVRAVQHSLKEQGVKFALEANDFTTGPAHAILQDPDGNPILIDQPI